MFTILTVGFEFKDNFYYALIRVKPKVSGTDYEVTVMNGNLEKLLYGNHVIEQRNDHLQIEAANTTEQELLKAAIADALSQFLKIPSEKKIRTDVPILASMPVVAQYQARDLL